MSYYEDLYGNQYRWTTSPDENGKYIAKIYKLKKDHGFHCFKLHKRIVFSKRRLVKAWCLKHVREAKTRQEKVLNDRLKRKQDRINAKPKYSRDEIKFQKTKKDIVRLETNIKRANTKIKTLATRKHTYEKKIKVNLRRIEKLAGLV